MGLLDDAVRLAQSTGTPVDIAAVRAIAAAPARA